VSSDRKFTVVFALVVSLFLGGCIAGSFAWVKNEVENQEQHCATLNAERVGTGRYGQYMCVTEDGRVVWHS
jgi:uncharacterized membrane protein